MAFIDNVKQWFKTGDFPTQAQFWQKFEWLRWKDEPIAISEVTNLQDTLNYFGIQKVVLPVGATSVQLQADTVLDKVLVKQIGAVANMQFNLKIGTAAGLDDIANVDIDFAASNDQLLTVPKWIKNTTTIFFTNLEPNTQLIIYKQ